MSLFWETYAMMSRLCESHSDYSTYKVQQQQSKTMQKHIRVSWPVTHYSKDGKYAFTENGICYEIEKIKCTLQEDA